MRNVVLRIVLPLLLLAGCQNLQAQQPEQWRWNCTDKAYDAGRCEQPSNINLFGYIIGDR